MTSAASSTAKTGPRPARVNHACRPNAVGYAVRGEGGIYAARPTKAGEQITIDYGALYLAPRGCRCDACVMPPGD